jgi:hypothetical protein
MHAHASTCDIKLGVDGIIAWADILMVSHGC